MPSRIAQAASRSATAGSTQVHPYTAATASPTTTAAACAAHAALEPAVRPASWPTAAGGSVLVASATLAMDRQPLREIADDCVAAHLGYEMNVVEHKDKRLASPSVGVARTHSCPGIARSRSGACLRARTTSCVLRLTWSWLCARNRRSTDGTISRGTSCGMCSHVSATSRSGRSAA